MLREHTMTLEAPLDALLREPRAATLVAKMCEVAIERLRSVGVVFGQPEWEVSLSFEPRDNGARYVCVATARERSEKEVEALKPRKKSR